MGVRVRVTVRVRVRVTVRVRVRVRFSDHLGVLLALGRDARGLGELLHGDLHLVAPGLLDDAVLLHGALLGEDLGEDVRVAGGALHEALHLHGHIDLVRAWSGRGVGLGSRLGLGLGLG